MSLPPEVSALVLLAALAHAAWNTVVKVGGDRLVVLAVVNGTGAVLAAAALGGVGLPASASWPYLGLSVLIHTGYYLFLVEAYRHGDLSQVYPLARGISPLLVATGAALLAGEWISPLGSAGVGLACAGIAALSFEGGVTRAGWRPVGFALGTGCLIAAYTVVDGLGVRRAGNPVAYILWLFFLDGLPIAILALALRRAGVVRVLRREGARAVAGGALQLLAYGLVIWAMSRGPMAAVSALRETSVIFAALIGAFALREPFGAIRIAAAVAVAAGIAVMRAFG